MVSWSRTAQSSYPVTTGVMVASQAAASASIPVRWTIRGGGGAGGGQAGFGGGGAGQAVQGRQVDVDLDVHGLPVRAGSMWAAISRWQRWLEICIVIYLERYAKLPLLESLTCEDA